MLMPSPAKETKQPGFLISCKSVPSGASMSCRWESPGFTLASATKTRRSSGWINPLQSARMECEKSKRIRFTIRCAQTLDLQTYSGGCACRPEAAIESIGSQTQQPAQSSTQTTLNDDSPEAPSLALRCLPDASLGPARSFSNADHRPHCWDREGSEWRAHCWRRSEDGKWGHRRATKRKNR